MDADKGVNEGWHVSKIGKVVIPEIRQRYNAFHINFDGTFNIFCQIFIL